MKYFTLSLVFVLASISAYFLLFKEKTNEPKLVFTSNLSMPEFKLAEIQPKITPIKSEVVDVQFEKIEEITTHPTMAPILEVPKAALAQPNLNTEAQKAINKQAAKNYGRLKVASLRNYALEGSHEYYMDNEAGYGELKNIKRFIEFGTSASLEAQTRTTIEEAYEQYSLTELSVICGNTLCRANWKMTVDDTFKETLCLQFNDQGTTCEEISGRDKANSQTDFMVAMIKCSNEALENNELGINDNRCMEPQYAGSVYEKSARLKIEFEQKDLNDLVPLPINKVTLVQNDLGQLEQLIRQEIDAAHLDFKSKIDHKSEVLSYSCKKRFCEVTISKAQAYLLGQTTGSVIPDLNNTFSHPLCQNHYKGQMPKQPSETKQTIWTDLTLHCVMPENYGQLSL